MMIIEAFSIPAIRYAFYAMLIAGATFSPLGVVIVSLNLTAIRFTFMHVGLLGAAIGLSLGFSSNLGAFGTVLVASLLMGFFARRLKLSSSSLMALFMTATLSAAFLILAFSDVMAMQVFSIFSGNILFMTRANLFVIAVLGGVILLAFFVFYREMQLLLVDEEIAEALGVPLGLVYVIVYFLLGAGVAAALSLVGALLVDGIILLPAIAALRFAKSFSSALVLSSLLGILTCSMGFFLALTLDLPVGASTAGVASVVLGISLAWTSIKKVKEM